ncbi:fused response regulator/phosphatase [Luedemannella helvata]|uniref:SpoIIE family protein phosphatase n=1 Tax=Luedemannella helvata TaxID=349315 RepID=A0ABP4WPV7_9ACTN
MATQMNGHAPVPVPARSAIGDDRTAVRSHRLRVLLVEDDEQDAMIVQDELAIANAPIDVVQAFTIAEARGMLDGVDCVLLDLGLPDAQGLGALEQLLSVADRTAVCVLTGLGDEALGMEAVARGAEDYLIKGQVDGAGLSRALHYAVSRKRLDENAMRLREIEMRQQESARLERGLLPQPVKKTDAIGVHMFYRPGRHSATLGGDFYDVVQTGPDRIDLLVGDVAGHDIDEAALGVMLRVGWRALTLAGVPEEAVLAAVEQVLVTERAAEEIFATVATVTVDLAQSRVAVRLAGHPPPLLLSHGRCAPLPAAFGTVLGVVPGAIRPTAHVDLDSEDWSLLMYTDGLIEGRYGDGTERLGVERLCTLLSTPEGRAVPLPDLPAWLVGRAEEFNGGPLVDDVAMLLLTSRDGGR